MRVVTARWWQVPMMIAALVGGQAVPLFGAQEGKALGVVDRDAINPGLPPLPFGVARSTAEGAWESLRDLCAGEKYAAAAHLLDLAEIRPEAQLALGQELAAKLCRLLRSHGVHTTPVEALGAGARATEAELNAVVVAHLRVPGLVGEVWLGRTRDRTTGEVAWLVTRRTVSNLPLWYGVVVEGRKLLEERAPLNAGLGPPPAGLHRGNPQDAVNTFLNLARRGDFATAAHLLDLRRIPAEQQVQDGSLAARRLMLMLVRQGWVRPSQLSNDPAGAPEQGVAEDRELVARVPHRNGEVGITLQRNLDPELGVVWTFSAETVGEIETLYRTYGYGVIGDRLPIVFFSLTLAGLQLWQWTALLLIVVSGWFLGRLVGHWVVSLLHRLARRTSFNWDDVVAHTLDGPLGIVLWGALLILASPWVGLDAASFTVTHTVFRLLVLVGLGWLLFRTVDAITGHLRRTAGDANALALGFIPVFSKVLKALVVVLGVLAALDTVGVNVVALVAGLGLGGLAIAFAAQKTIENLFGAVAIAGDRPFKVGDFVSIGEITGTVEDVGLRSTRLRTLQRTLVTIPNGAVAAEKITNLTARDRMLFNPVLSLVYGTKVEQLVYVIDEIRKLLLSHPRVFQESQRVRFKGFGSYALEVEVVAWIETRDFVEYTALAEELNFAIAGVVQASGTTFAFPTQTLYLGRAGGLDTERAGEVAREVERRRVAGELAIPEPSPELRQRLQPSPSQGGGEGI